MGTTEVIVIIFINIYIIGYNKYTTIVYKCYQLHTHGFFSMRLLNL